MNNYRETLLRAQANADRTGVRWVVWCWADRWYCERASTGPKVNYTSVIPSDIAAEILRDRFKIGAVIDKATGETP